MARRMEAGGRSVIAAEIGFVFDRGVVEEAVGELAGVPWGVKDPFGAEPVEEGDGWVRGVAADDGAAFADDGADGGGVAGDFVGEVEEVLELGFDGGAGGGGGSGGEVVPCVA